MVSWQNDPLKANSRRSYSFKMNASIEAQKTGDVVVSNLIEDGSIALKSCGSPSTMDWLLCLNLIIKCKAFYDLFVNDDTLPYWCINISRQVQTTPCSKIQFYESLLLVCTIGSGDSIMGCKIMLVSEIRNSCRCKLRATFLWSIELIMYTSNIIFNLNITFGSIIKIPQRGTTI